jgi:hypothetical protein
MLFSFINVLLLGHVFIAFSSMTASVAYFLQETFYDLCFLSLHDGDMLVHALNCLWIFLTLAFFILTAVLCVSHNLTGHSVYYTVLSYIL